jgi:hypothetical protein
VSRDDAAIAGALELTDVARGPAWCPAEPLELEDVLHDMSHKTFLEGHMHALAVAARARCDAALAELPGAPSETSGG